LGKPPEPGWDEGASYRPLHDPVLPVRSEAADVPPEELEEFLEWMKAYGEWARKGEDELSDLTDSLAGQEFPPPGGALEKMVLVGEVMEEWDWFFEEDDGP